MSIASLNYHLLKMSYEAIAMLGNWGLPKNLKTGSNGIIYVLECHTCTVNKKSMDELLSATLKKYQSESATGKTFSFAKGFLKYLTKTKLDAR